MTFYAVTVVGPYTYLMLIDRTICFIKVDDIVFFKGFLMRQPRAHAKPKTAKKFLDKT